jgi:hypothetical protein
VNTHDNQDLDNFCAKLDMPEFGLSGDTYKNWTLFLRQQMEELVKTEDEVDLAKEAESFVKTVKVYAEAHLFTPEFRRLSKPAITFSQEDADALMLTQTQYKSRAEFYRQFILPIFVTAKKEFAIPTFTRKGVMGYITKFTANLLFGVRFRKSTILYNAFDELEINFSTSM